MSDTSPSSRTRGPGGWLLLGAIVLALTGLHVITYGVEADKPGARWLGLGVMDVDVVTVVLLYLAVVVAIRWQMIAMPIQNQLRARIDQIDLATPAITDENRRARVEGLVREARQATAHQTAVDVLFWSRGRETAGWTLVDLADQELVAEWPTARVLARAEALAAEAKAEGTDAGLALEKAFQTALTSPPGGVVDVDRLRGMVVEQISRRAEVLHARDKEIDYHNNKILWYIVIALISIVLITNFLPHVNGSPIKGGFDQNAAIALLVGGGVGGVISRLARAVRSSYTTHELGLRWMALFLSPLRGALAGWAGVTLLQVSADLNLLHVGTETKETVASLGLALLFGVSERYFDDLVERAENRGRTEETKEGAETGTPNTGQGSPQVGTSTPGATGALAA